MKKQLFQNKLFVKKSKLHGYGVYAGKGIKKKEKIEECYVVLCKGGDKGLEDFYFDANRRYAVLTGFGLIYNHSDNPNAEYIINPKTRVATIKAARPIHKNEEIFVSYGKKWFSSRGLTPKIPKGKK